jgi:hypothetical protein
LYFAQGFAATSLHPAFSSNTFVRTVPFSSIRKRSCPNLKVVMDFGLRLQACRRNNKDEKRKRNYANALKFRSRDGISRRKKVKAEQRAAEVAKQEGFSALIFQHTTDADIPPFTDFFD